MLSCSECIEMEIAILTTNSHWLGGLCVSQHKLWQVSLNQTWNWVILSLSGLGQRNGSSFLSHSSWKHKVPATVAVFRFIGRWQENNKFLTCSPEDVKPCVSFLPSHSLYFCNQTTGKATMKMINSIEIRLHRNLTSKCVWLHFVIVRQD